MQFFQMADFGVSGALALIMLFIIYIIAMINRQLRMAQYQISTLEEDVKLISEELKMLSTRGIPSAQQTASPDKRA